MCSLAKIYLARTDPFAIPISRVGGWEDAMGSFFSSLQVFQEAANLFLDLLGKLLAQSDDSEQTFRRDSLMVISSGFWVFVFPIFSCFSQCLSYAYVTTRDVIDVSPCAVCHMSNRGSILRRLKLLK